MSAPLPSPLFVVTLPASRSLREYSIVAKNAGATHLEVVGTRSPQIFSESDSALPVIASPRGASVDWVRALEPRIVDLDFELDDRFPTEKLSPETKIIRSAHDHDHTPDLGTLQHLLARLDEAGGDFLKIATTVHRYRDVARLEEFRQRAPSALTGRLAVVAMSPATSAGVQPSDPNRALLPWRSPLVYACVDSADASAPGQWPLDRYPRGPEPALFGILGGPDLASESPRIHNARFREHGDAACYLSFPTDDLDDVWSLLRDFPIQGLSVTTPWKRAVAARVDRLDDAAEAGGACNTIVRRGHTLFGTTTDAEGIVAGYPHLRGSRTATIVGSGGVVPAVIDACRRLEIDRITVAARNEGARELLAARHSIAAAPLADLPQHPAEVIFWAIPTDEAVPELPPAGERAHAIDLRYGEKLRSLFLRRAAEVGYETMDGRPMLDAQARCQAELFREALSDEQRASAKHGRDDSARD